MEFAPPAYPSASASPGFSFASPAGSVRRSIASSPSQPSAPYAASFLDSASPLLPRRSPRLSSRVLSSFSPSPSLFNRTLSAYSPSPLPSSKRLRGESLYDLAQSLPDDSWDGHMQAQPSSPTASSQSTPIPSMAGGQDRADLEPRASSDRAGDRSLRLKSERRPGAEESNDGEGESGQGDQHDRSMDGSYPDHEEQNHLQRDSSSMSAASTASKQHARLSQLQQQLLRAASTGDAPQPASKRTKKEEASDDEDEHDRTGQDDRSTAERDDHWPQSSSASASSSASFPSLSSLSTAFNTPDAKPSLSHSHSHSLSPLSPSSAASHLSDSERVDRSGESCHQCKTRRLPTDLIYCSARHLKKGRARKKKKERLCRKKYCARCFPEADTRVLTNSGFLFLADIEARIEAKQPVLYACYEQSTQSIVYRPGQLVLVAPPKRWVDFTHAGTRRLWDATSDDYGVTVPANDLTANRLTLRTTPDHDMYVQLCTGYEKDGHELYEPRLAGGAPVAPHKQTARELAPGYQCDCDTAGRVCTHGYSHYRMYTGAASGLHQPADIISMIDNDDIHSPVAALGLHSKDELDAFLELFGYWLGHGTLSHGTRADLTSADAVCFAPRKDSDCVYLLGLLARLHLERGQDFTSSESESRLVVRIIEPRWFRFFDDEFGVKCSDSRHYNRRLALLKQGMHNTQLSSSTASPVSSTPALSVSASSSFSLNASVADYSGNDDMSLLGADPVVDEEQDEEEAVASAKWLPDWVLFRLNAEQLRLVIVGLRQADGSSAAGDKTVQGEHELCTSSVGFRDQLIHACMHAGYSAYFELNTAAGEVLGYEAVPYDSWRVCYSEAISELLPAQDVRFDGSPCRVREQSAAMSTQPADLYDQQRDGRVWCVDVQHDDHLIFVQRAHRNASGVVTKVGRTLITGNCLNKFYNEAPPAVNGPDSGQSWVCPGCRGVCSCAACKRHAIKREQRERKMALKGGKNRRRGGGGSVLEKASEAKVVRAAGLDGNTAMAAPVTAVAASATKAVPVSVAIPADSQSAAPSMAINIDSAGALAGSAMAPPAPMHSYALSGRRSPRLIQRNLPSTDVVSLGPMQSSFSSYLPSSSSSGSSPSHLSSFASPTSSYPPPSFSFNHNDMSLAASPSYFPSQPSTAFQASPLLPPHLLLSSPSHTSLASPYGHSSSSGGGAGGPYGFGATSPLMSPGPGLYRRSPRLNGRVLSESGGGSEWGRPYGY